MDNDHGITGELREWAKALTHWWYDPVKNEYTYTTSTMPPSIDAIRLDEHILAIADRIDAEHEKALHEAYTKGYEDGVGVANAKDAQAEYPPSRLTFLGSKELFDQYDWAEDGQLETVQISEDKLVRHMVDKSGMTQSDVSEKMGKGRGYVLTMTSRGSSPSAANLAKLAKACGYRLVLEGHGESLCIVENDD